MRVVFVGNTYISWMCLKRLLEANKNVVGVFMPRGRLASMQSGFKSFEDLGERYGVTIYPIDNINSPETVNTWRLLEPDLGIIVGWSQIIKKEILNVPKMGCLGFHAALLPWGRGGAPVNWSIINGDKEIGTTLFYVDEGVDSGDIVAQNKIPITLKDTCKTVFDKLGWVNANLLMDTLPKIESGTWPRKPQLWEKATYRPTRRPEDGLIAWNRTPMELYNWVRALTHPYPGAFTFFERKKLFIWEINIPTGTSAGGRPGEIIGVNNGDGLKIGCGEGAVIVRRMQFEGEPEMWGEDFYQNYELKNGAILGKPEDYPPYLHIDLLSGNGRDYEYETNLGIGEAGKSILRTANYEKEAPSVQVIANFDEKTILDKKLDLNFGEGKEVEIEYTGTHSGISTLKIILKRNEKIFKKKELIVVVHP